MWLLGSSTGGRIAKGGLLAQLYFVPVHEQAEGVFRIQSALVRTKDGDIVKPIHLGQAKVRRVPQVFALQVIFELRHVGVSCSVLSELLALAVEK